MIRRLLILAALACLHISAWGQNYGGGVDDEKIHFGFTFQYITSEYRVVKAANWQAPLALGRLQSIRSEPTPGFGLGFVSDLALGKQADLRVTPALGFTDRVLDYNFLSVNARKIVKATTVDLPVGIKYKSDRLGNFRAYLLGGIKYSADIISRAKTDNANITEEMKKYINNRRGVLSYEAGVGLDFYFEYFKLSPEIKLSNSFQNVLTPEAHAFSAPIDKLLLRNFQFSLYFE